ncbi:hypothetical protein MB02_10595 [Croceicoccus estronivorus]|uniref:TonB-dependent receptor n=1 Tax=Croceicoccus estronivorus TaxID=1172626 RepID=UPI00082C9DB5|nr:TonB-dependent receptor [Croceicoccus estronivorus]OCC23610.1 hypothetical protein MB02_10595 [Croceicoccus estronivorus]
MRVSRSKVSVRCLCGTAALAVTSPVFAQEGRSEPSISAGEIIVNAQRREERAQDVPVVITAISSQKLEQLDINEPQDLYGMAPSLVVGNQGQATRDVQSFSIRGQSTGFLSSPAVAQYLSEVPLVASVSLNLQGAPGLFSDVENVQILAGAQGTLFGRNTTGGAVLFMPRKPVNQVEGYIQGSVGNLNLRGVEGAINIPIIDDKLMIRAAGAFMDRDGFTRDLSFNKNRDDVHWYSGKLGILVRPTESIENYTLIFGSKSSNNGSGFIHKGFNMAALRAYGFCSDTPNFQDPANLATYCSAYTDISARAAAEGPRKTRLSVDAYSKIELWGVINSTDIELGDNLKLRNIISYQRLKDDYAADQDGTPLQQYELNQNAGFPTVTDPLLAGYGIPLAGYNPIAPTWNYPRDEIGQFTEEFQIQGNALDSKLQFTAGYFHFNAKPESEWGTVQLTYCPALYTGLCSATLSNEGVSNKSDAFYGQTTLDLGAFSPALDSLRLTAGYRYTWDTIKGFVSRWTPDPLTETSSCLIGGNTLGDVPTANARELCEFSDTLKSKAPTWTFGVDYKPIKDILIYAKVSRGYKAGGFNTYAVREETRTFAPEKLTTYEAGFKSDFQLGRMPVRLNVTYYHSNYLNIQRPQGDYNPETGASGAQVLAATARIRGVEIEGSIRPLPGLELGGTFSRTNADYRDFKAVVFSPTQACNGLKQYGEVADFSCYPFQFVTPTMYSVYGSYDMTLGQDLGDLSLYVSYFHVASQNVMPSGDSSTEPGAELEPYGLLNASASLRNIGGTGLDLTVFANNLTNKLYRTMNSNSFNNLLASTTLFGEPRTYGLKVKYSF